MKLVKVEKSGFCAQGVLDGDIVHLVGDWAAGDAEATNFSLPSLGVSEIKRRIDRSRQMVSLSEVNLAVPVDPLRKIICAGINYRDHAGETKNEEPANPILFMRSLDSLVPHDMPIICPKVSQTFDFEGEIAVIIGTEARHVSAADAMSHVFGYCAFMDGSVREYQRHALSTGKNFWKSGSMGPWIVTADEIASANLSLETRLNGTVVQSAHLSDLIFSIAQLIEYCSRWTVLRPGDVIATGTPGGVGSRRRPPLWMKPGDEIVVEVEKLGLLRNPIIAEAEA